MEIICIKLTFAIKVAVIFHLQTIISQLLSLLGNISSKTHLIDVRMYFVWGET